MKEEDVPFMDYRVTACFRCRETLLLQSDLLLPPPPAGCSKCGELVERWVAVGRKGAALVWGEEEVS